MLSRTPTVRSVTSTLVALLFVSACAETATSPLPTNEIATSGQATFDASADQDHGHVMMTRGQLERLNAASAHGGGGTGIFYHGGPVLQAGTNVAAVYWASSPIFVNGPAAGTT